MNLILALPWAFVAWLFVARVDRDWLTWVGFIVALGNTVGLVLFVERPRLSHYAFSIVITVLLVRIYVRHAAAKRAARG